MLARLQKWIVAGVLLSSLLALLIELSLGHLLWGLLITALIVTSYVAFLGAEFLMVYAIQDERSPHIARVGDLLQAWWGEIVMAPRVFMWRQPFCSNALPDHLPENSSRRGIVFVHGLVCNRGFWNPWLQKLSAEQVPFIAVNLEPLFGSIDGYVDTLEAAVSQMEAVTNMKPILVGHSMGGMAIRAWLDKFAADERVYRIITIASPHQGTWLARFGHSINGRQMRIGSPWLAALSAREPSSRAKRFTCFYGHCDNVVFPAVRGMLPGAVNLHVPHTAHVQMAFRAVVLSELQHWLDLPADDGSVLPSGFYQ